MRILVFLLWSGLALPAFSESSMVVACCPECQYWQDLDFYLHPVVYTPEELSLGKLVDCVMWQQKWVGL